MKHAVLFLLTLLLLPVSAHADIPQSLDDLEAYIEQGLDDWDIPGLALAIVKDGEIIHSQGYGVKDLETQEPVDADTLFAIASNSKLFTCAALGLLVEDEALSWNDPVVKHLPHFELSDPYRTRELNVRDMVTHRHGLRNSIRLWYGSGFSSDEILRRMKYMPTAFSLRNGYQYNNIAFMVAGEVIEAIDGRTWHQFIEDRIFFPLGMHNTISSESDLHRFGNVSTPYAKIDGELEPIVWYNMDNVAPCGSIISTANDMALWLRMHLAMGKHNDKQILSEDTIITLRTPQTILSFEADPENVYLPNSTYQFYGHGYVIHDIKQHWVYEHGGNMDGQSSRTGIIPDLGLGVVVLTNIDSTLFQRALLYQVYDLYLGGEPIHWSERFLKNTEERREASEEREAEREETRAKDTTPSLPLEAYAGTYTHPMYGTVTITHSDDSLRFAYNDAGLYVGALNHWHYDTFDAVMDYRYLGEWPLTFRLNGDGSVDEVHVGASVNSTFRKTD